MIQPSPGRGQYPPWRVSPFGELVAIHRALRGYSINRLAREAGVNPAYAYRWEKGGQVPSRSVVLKIIEALGLTVEVGDRLLYVAGYAPQVDWQAICERAAEDAAASIAETIARAVADAEE